MWMRVEGRCVEGLVNEVEGRCVDGREGVWRERKVCGGRRKGWWSGLE